MTKVAVIGFGHGGTVAAIKLAEAGYAVEIFDKALPGRESYPWYDDIRFDVFDICKIPAPDKEFYTQKSKWLFVSPDEKNSLKVPPAKPMEEVSVSRRGLVRHLLTLAENAGAKVHYGVEVQRLVLRRDRVVGIAFDSKEYLFDLVIDASGFNSPFRGQVPSKFGVQDKPGKNDVMVGWREFYKRREGSAVPDPESVLYIKHRDGAGISWCNLNDRNEVDVLIGRIGALSDEERDASVAALKAKHEIMTDEPLYAGRYVDIALRCPIARMVADGYAAVGDSAFMSMPLMGSGIESSMKAGTWLAETVVEGQIADFTADRLWAYERKFFDELGCDYVFIDVLKRWALNLDSAEINWLFGCGAVTNEDMALVSTDSENPAKIPVGAIIKKVFIILRRPRLVGQAIGCVLRALKAKNIAKSIPEKYDATRVDKWQKKYDGIIA